MTRAAAIEVLQYSRDEVGESPLWDAATGCLWWVDIAGHAVHRRHLATGTLTSFATPFHPGALALHEDGSLIIAGGTGWHRLDPATGGLTDIASVAGQQGLRMNDGVVDHAGRFWAGTMSLAPEREAVGKLCRLEGDRVIEVLGGLRTQNGTAVSPDGKTFYLSDSHPSVCVIWAFDFDVGTAVLSNRRLFHKPVRGRPDGAAVDTEGCYWFAAVDAGQILRLDPAGKAMQAIDLPVTRPTNLAFGGPDLSTLYITTMRAGLDQNQLAEQSLAGAVLALDPGARGWPQPRVKPIPVPSSAAAGVFETANNPREETHESRKDKSIGAGAVPDVDATIGGGAALHRLDRQ